MTQRALRYSISRLKMSLDVSYPLLQRKLLSGFMTCSRDGVLTALMMVGGWSQQLGPKILVCLNTNNLCCAFFFLFKKKKLEKFDTAATTYTPRSTSGMHDIIIISGVWHETLLYFWLQIMD